MQLLWNPERLPRTMTRGQWQEIDRWRRVTQRELRKQAQSMMHDMAAYGSTVVDIDKFINPPLLVHPLMMPR